MYRLLYLHFYWEATHLWSAMKCLCTIFRINIQLQAPLLENIYWLAAGKNGSMYPVYIKEKCLFSQSADFFHMFLFTFWKGKYIRKRGNCWIFITIKALYCTPLDIFASPKVQKKCCMLDLKKIEAHFLQQCPAKIRALQECQQLFSHHLFKKIPIGHITLNWIFSLL